MKLSYLVAALGFVAATAAHATIVNSSPTGASEAILAVFDSHGSYALDLGISYSSFASLASTQTFNLSGSANFAAFLAGVVDPTALQYAVIDAKTNNGGNNAALLSTVNVAFVGGIVGTYNNTDIQNSVGQVNNYQVALNASGTHANPGNGDSFNPTGSPAYYLTNATDSFNSFGFNNANAVGTSSVFETVRRTQTNLGDPIETVIGSASFGLNGSAYQLVITPVPEPSGLGLALAGLGVLGFMGVRRNRG